MPTKVDSPLFYGELWSIPLISPYAYRCLNSCASFPLCHHVTWQLCSLVFPKYLSKVTSRFMYIYWVPESGIYSKRLLLTMISTDHPPSATVSSWEFQYYIFSCARVPVIRLYAVVDPIWTLEGRSAIHVLTSHSLSICPSTNAHKHTRWCSMTAHSSMANAKFYFVFLNNFIILIGIGSWWLLNSWLIIWNL